MNILRALGCLWLIPITILVWVLYILPLWALGWIKCRGWGGFAVIEFRVVERDTWYYRAWRRWGGWSGPQVILLIADNPEVRAHELRHCDQQFVLGPFFYWLYAMYWFVIWIFLPSKSPYYDNPFEIDARRYAKRFGK